MKNKFLAAVAALAFISLMSCSSSDDSSSMPAGTEKMYIKTVNVTSSDPNYEPTTFTVNYDAQGRVISTNDGVETNYLAYEEGNLQNISGASDVLAIADITSNTQDAYEIGDVLEYDSNGNPVKLRLYSRDWDGSIEAEFTGDITYENKPNPFYYTLDAAGIIDVLNDTQLNFSTAPQNEDLVMAKMLLPVNNPKKLVVKDADGVVQGQVVADYVYNDKNYPTTATFTSTGDGNTEITSVTYTYKN